MGESGWLTGRPWAICLALLWALAGCSPPAPEAPLFALSALDGPPVALADLRGRWVLVNFWATWCAPCREEMADLQRLAEENPEQLVVLGVNMRESPEDIRAFLAEQPVTFPILLQPDDGTLLAYGVRGLPMSVLISPEGRVEKRIIGPLDTTQLALDGLRYPSKR